MRSASLPPLGGGQSAGGLVANPFWSEQTRAEAELKARRPVDLPVPHDDDEFDEPRQRSGRSVRSPKPLEERPRGRGRSAEGQNRIFTTPASWGSVDGPLRTAGLMRDGDLEEERSRVFGGTQGPAPKEEVRGEPGELQQDILERALEREMVSILHKENLQLKEELQAMKERMSSTAWSEVTPSVDVPRPPEGTPPRSGGLRMEEGWEILHTPNGTRVPTGPPPPEMPPWPFHYYEKEEGMADCMKWLGPWEDEGLRRLTLHDPVYGGGNDSRHGLRDGGRNSRMMRDGSHSQGLCEGGRQSRRDEELMSAAEARAVWMERELHGMKQALDQMKRAGLNSGYWSEPANREERGRGGVPRDDRAWQHGELHEQGRAQHPDLLQQGRAQHPDLLQQGRAQHPDLPQQGRAQHPDLPQQGRAQHPDLPQQGRAQHSELPQQGRAEHHDLLQHGRAEQQDLPHQDRAEHQDLPHQGRAGLEKEEKNGVALCHGRGQGQGLHDGKGHGQEDEGNRAPPYPGSEQSGQGSKMELPALPQETTPMDLGDWLTLITPSMKDMANNASFWWECTLAEATRFYELWRQSTPLQRVQLKPALPEELKTRQFERTEQRGVGLLLRALPGEMRNVIISNRDMASTAILWRLLITFQPGGNGEKGQLLKVLTTSSTVSTASQLASHLRQWRRCFTRAREIGACVPDGTLMVYALESSAMALGKMDGQAAFRIASSRAQLGVDEKPEAETVLLYSQVLLAEAETLTLSGTSSTTSGTTATAKVKAMQTQFGKGSPPTTSTSSPCKFWGSEAGCKFGKACKYDHPVLGDQKDRCWICSSTQHRKLDCPAKGMTPHGSGGSGQDGKGGTSSTSIAKGGKGKGQKGKQGQIQGGSSQPAQGQVQDKPAVNKLEKEMNDKIEKETLNKQNEATTTGSTGTSPEQPTTGETELLSEVTSLLRSLRAPSMQEQSRMGSSNSNCGEPGFGGGNTSPKGQWDPSDSGQDPTDHSSSRSYYDRSEGDLARRTMPYGATRIQAGGLYGPRMPMCWSNRRTKTDGTSGRDAHKESGVENDQIEAEDGECDGGWEEHAILLRPLPKRASTHCRKGHWIFQLWSVEASMEQENKEKDWGSNNPSDPPVLWQEQEQMAGIGTRGDARSRARRLTGAGDTVCGYWAWRRHAQSTHHGLPWESGEKRKGRYDDRRSPMQNGECGKVERWWWTPSCERQGAGEPMGFAAQHDSGANSMRWW